MTNRKVAIIAGVSIVVLAFGVLIFNSQASMRCFEVLDHADYLQYNEVQSNECDGQSQAMYDVNSLQAGLGKYDMIMLSNSTILYSR